MLKKATKNFSRFIVYLTLMILSSGNLFGQVSGTKTIPADYVSLAAFITDINTNGIGSGGVTLNIPSGYTETAPIGGFAITATGTAANPIIIQGTGGAPKPLITAYAGGTGTPGSAVQDGIFRLVGSDYVTINGIDLAENAANTANPATMEYGYALYKASATDGCQNNSIRNCTVTLNRVNNATGTAPMFDGSIGILMINSTPTAATTSLTVTAATGASSNNTFYSNTIQNCNIGIALSGFAASTPFTLADAANEIGGAALAQGNTILNFGGGAATNPAAGIRTLNQWSLFVRNNTVNNNNGSGVNHATTLRGIFIGAATSANTTITGNTVTLQGAGTTTVLTAIDNASGSTAASNTVTISNNTVQYAYATATTGVATAINNSSTAATLTISSNNISGIPATFLAGTGTHLGIEAGSPVNVSITNNTLQNIQRNGASGSWRILKFTSPTTTTVSGNLIENISWTGTTSTGSIDGIYGLSSSVDVSITNNIVRNLSTPTTGTINGIREFGVSGIKNVANNQVYNFSTTVGGAGGGTYNGIFCSTGTITISTNQIYNLNGTGNTTVNGVQISGGTNWTISRNKIYSLSTLANNTTNGIVNGILATTNGGSIVNNVISGLSATLSAATDAIRGISYTSGTAATSALVAYNTVYLSGISGGANFGTSGIFHTGSTTATTAVLDLRNNIIINETTPVGTGAAVAFRRGTAASTNLAPTSNRNLLFAGTPGASNLIYTDGTTPQQTLINYASNVAPVGHDINSITGEPFLYGTAGSFFVSLTGSSSDFLRPVAGITTQVESGAAAIVAVTTDFDNVTRPASGTNPDMGAFEFAGQSPTPVVTLNSVTPPTTAQCATTPRLVSVNVTTPIGSITTVNLVYSINGTPQANIPMTNTSGTTWEGTIPVATPVNGTVSWGVTATNSIGVSGSFTGTPYADEPLFGYLGTASASVSTVCAGSPTTLTASITAPGNPTYAAPPAVTNPTTDEDLRQIIISQGATVLLNNTSTLNTLDGTIGTPTGTVGSYSNFTAAPATNLIAGQTYNYFMTSIDGAPTYYPNNGAGYIDFNRDGDFLDAGEQIFNGPMLNKTVDNGIDSIIGTFTVPSNAISGLTRMRILINEGAITGPTMTVGYGEYEEYAIHIQNISAVSWSDGVGTVGTGTSIVVNPTTTTTYTANITSLGCTLSPSPTVTVTVNPLPTAPTATNSAQCGNAVPTASVTSTSGLSTPTFIWYSAAAAGTALQTSTSNTYTTAISATTTFYVAELNTVTGCESTRTPVTVTVASADNITASSNNATICIGSSFNLSVVNANPTPVQSYTYTWTNAETGSGLTSVTGANQTVTPTQPGTYTYNVAGVDGSCNALSSVSVTVNPFSATLTPINITCNGYNNGSFSLATTSCGSAPFSYIVDGGALTTTIPTNLTPGAHTVIVQNTAGFQTSVINITITQPSTIISTPVGTNASVCQNAASATISATSTVSAQTLVIPFTVSAQPTELSSSTVPATVAASPNVFATTVMPALPAGSTITSATLNYNGIQATGSSWQSDVRLGITGAINLNYTQGTGAPNSAGTFNYVATIPVGGVSATGGTVNLNYFDFFNDNGGSEATFPTGSNVASITITYTPPSTVSWWTAATGGTQIGTGSPFETVGTSVVPNTNTPGVYTVYAQGDFSGCSNLTRTPVTVTVRPISTSTTNITACSTYTWTNGTAYTSSGTYTQTLVNSVGCDSIATLNLTINQPSTATQTASACVTYTWPVNSTTFTTSGVYTHTLVGANAVGCDSTITLNLTINQPTTATQTVSACTSYFWPVNGTSYTTSGTYTHTLVGANAAGCDSTITLNLTIGLPTASLVAVTACTSYTWLQNGVTYTSSGAYNDTIPNAAGCDSVVTLSLTINQPTSSTVNATACSSYTWIQNGLVYTTSGAYTDTISNAVGCDSIITLNLTIIAPTSSSVNATACSSYTWPQNGITYTTSGAYNDTIPNSVGCDSVITLNLTINSPATGTDVQSACGSYTWIDGNTYTTSNSTATHTITGGAANGCDSIVTLNLTINALPTPTATDNGNGTFTASVGSSYQWINCTTNQPIAGATSANFAPTANGSYAVITSNAAGCSDTSSCVTISNVGLNEHTVFNLAVHPNPTTGLVKVVYNSDEKASVQVFDAAGKLIQTHVISSNDTIDLTSVERGVYFLKIESGSNAELIRIVKQ